MQDTTAGNKNAGNVMRKKTPREHKMPNENAAHDTIAYTTLIKGPVARANPSMPEL